MNVVTMANRNRRDFGGHAPVLDAAECICEFSKERVNRWQESQDRHQGNTAHQPPASPEPGRRQLHFVQPPVGSCLHGEADAIGPSEEKKCVQCH